MIFNKVPRPAPRFLLDRLQRLQETLEALGQRLREGIAQIISKHLGEAVRDAVEAVLCSQPTRPFPERPTPYHHGYHDPYGYPHDGHNDEAFWEDHEPMSAEPKPQQTSSRWKSLLAGLVQLTTWTMHCRPKRPCLKKLLCIGAAVGIVALVAGPLAGGVVTTIGTTILLTRLADRTTEAIGQLATVTTP